MEAKGLDIKTKFAIGTAVVAFVAGWSLTIAGFIVGLSNQPDMSTGAMQYLAYDRVCRNCYEEQSISKPLTLLENGRAKCERCKRVYNLNNQGIPEQGEKGQKLYEYRGVTYNGNNTVEIRNP